jgi:hypothetical protein
MPAALSLSPKAALRSQRWRERRASFVSDASVIDPREFAVDVIPDRTARAFTVEHHYSGSHPVARLSLGLWRNGGAAGARLVGVATFSVSINDRAVPRHTGLDDPRAAADLGRFVLLDEVAGNGETWFLSRAFALLRRCKPQIAAVIAYSDPVPRRGPDGGVILPGHVGAIYRDFGRGVAYRGRATPRIEHLTPDGRPFSSRAASKIRNGERGAAYAVDELVRRGAPPAAEQDRWVLLRQGDCPGRRHEARTRSGRSGAAGGPPEAAVRRFRSPSVTEARPPRKPTSRGEARDPGPSGLPRRLCGRLVQAGFQRPRAVGPAAWPRSLSGT